MAGQERESVTESIKKADKYIIAFGGILFFINPGVGLLVILGGASIFISADAIQKWQKKGR